MTKAPLPVVTFETLEHAEKQAAEYRARFRGHKVEAFPHPDLLTKFAVAFITPAGRLAWHRA